MSNELKKYWANFAFNPPKIQPDNEQPEEGVWVELVRLSDVEALIAEKQGEIDKVREVLRLRCELIDNYEDRILSFTRQISELKKALGHYASSFRDEDDAYIARTALANCEDSEKGKNDGNKL